MPRVRLAGLRPKVHVAQYSAVSADRSALLIYNPAAGQWWRRPTPGSLRDALARRGFRAELFATEGQDHATELVRDHLRADTEVVWVCGGDGTVGQVASALVGSSTPIGILPIGTVNVIARECGIPNHPFAALDMLANTRSRRGFRTWTIGKRAALLGIGVGFDALVMGHVNPTAKDWLGFAGIGAQGAKEWARYDFPPLRVVGEGEDGQPFERRATQLLATTPETVRRAADCRAHGRSGGRLFGAADFQGRFAAASGRFLARSGAPRHRASPGPGR